jgi:hypothetical protein
LLGDAVVRPRDQVTIPQRQVFLLLHRLRVVVPLCQHVVDAVEPDHGFHVDRGDGIRIATARLSEAVRRERQQRRKDVRQSSRP